MIQLSEEQQCILDTVKEGHNVMVDAVAGTGKTTLILSIAREMPDTKILQLTYNASLRKDVKETVEKNDIQNLTVHTYHSLAKRYYLSTGYTDTEIRRLLFKNMPLKEVSPKYDMIVLDECQDMTLLYFQLMVKFIKDIDCNIQLLILGDYMQGLYDFKGADIRFLTMADQVWEGLTNLTTQGFQKRTMKMSFRITNQMRNFVNDVMLGEERMNACRDGSVVTYVRNSRNNISRVVYGEITKLLENGVNPSEIFVLGGSVKGANSNIRRLENTLVEKDVPCHVPMLEGDKIDDRVIDGKVVFSTFHSVKGRQRKYVFVVGFDNAYFRFNARTLPRDICPNTLYVAATRATEGLYLLESNNYATDRPLEFLKKSHIDMKRCDYINFKGHHQTIFQDEEDMNINDNVVKKHRITPTELVKFISESVIETISPIIDRIFIKETDETITLEIPSVIETKKGYFEEVSDLNGIAIPCVYYDYLKEAFSETEEEFDNIPRGNVLFDVIDNAIDNM
jgi:superfamily I DNA/RNA helicase